MNCRIRNRTSQVVWVANWALTVAAGVGLATAQVPSGAAFEIESLDPAFDQVVPPDAELETLGDHLFRIQVLYQHLGESEIESLEIRHVVEHSFLQAETEGTQIRNSEIICWQVRTSSALYAIYVKLQNCASSKRITFSLRPHWQTEEGE